MPKYSSLETSFFDDTLYREAAKKRLLGREEEAELIRHAQAGDSKALDRLVQRNIRFIYRVARKFVGRGLEFEDLVQEGQLGLLKAVEKFDLARETRLTTYAFQWIRAYCGRAVTSNQLVRQATTQAKRAAIGTVGETFRVMTLELEHEPTVAELAERMDIDENDLVGVLGAMTDNRRLSLDRNQDVYSDAPNTTYKDRIKDSALTQDVRTEVTKVTRRAGAIIVQAMGSLTARERDIFKRRFLSNPNETLSAIGKSYRLSRERIRQIERIVLNKTRGRLVGLGLERECANILELLATDSDRPGYGDCIERSSLLLKPSTTRT
ncbi:MAG: sigma-70 family RNA polymerase sigma factor [Patescibacteria group bacterium]|nr:sigma-70 family RNA polymerase sigma factor [Patescibacteria group bacterium]